MARGTGATVSAPGGWEAAALAAASEQDRAAFTIAADIFEARWYAEHPDVPRLPQDGLTAPGEGEDTPDGRQAAHGPHACGRSWDPERGAPSKRSGGVS